MSGSTRICVFCGAHSGARPVFARAARDLGAALAGRGIPLVFGGGSVGLMGQVADGALGAGGAAIGVIPQALVDRELAHEGLTELHVVTTMHERKAKMVELSSAFISLPGGLGTLDETFEILTWAQLGFHAKPVGLLNVDGYFSPLLAFLDGAVSEGFVPAASRVRWIEETDPERLISRLLESR
ncbi:MAG: TIGR00730 family Rossman fold protein [Planctomycetota bacterium]